MQDSRVSNTITIKFKAPIDTSSDENAAKEINYENVRFDPDRKPAFPLERDNRLFFKVEDEYKLLKESQFEKYCYIQSLKICYYLQKVR